MVPQGHSTRARLGALIAATALAATAAFATAPPVLGAGSISLTSFGVPYTQDFNALASSGTANTAVPAGWDFTESGTNANTLYRAGTGSDTAGDTYSFGASGNTERAFGGLRSGSLVPLIGAQFVNDTGSTIDNLAVSYTGEQWRLGQNTTGRAADRLDFQLSTSASSLTTGTWTDYDSLDFSSPVVAGTTGALNGNASPNRTPISAVISGLGIANSATFWLRWADSDLIPGSDDGLSVDDFSLTPTVADAAPSVLSTVPANGATEVSLNSTVTVTFSEPVNVSGSWFSLSCATSGDHAATVSGGPTTFTLDPSADFAMGEACTLTVYAANVTDQDLNDPPDDMTVNFTAGFTTALPIPIGTVNGQVPDSDTCAAHASPYAGRMVSIQGVIYETTLQAISNSTNTYKGFYIENTTATRDSDRFTSDGLFVFMSTASTIDGPGGAYTPAVGDEIVLTGKVSEYYNMTELVGPLTVQQVARSGVDIDAEVPPAVANPLVPLTDANCYWERRQGMRVQVPQDSVVLGGRNVFSPADAEIWVAPPDSTVAQRTTAYTDRAFRDAHPLDDNYDPAVWDGNGYRILMGSLGIKAAVGDAQALIDPARTFDTLTNAPSGGLNYTFSKYRIEVSEQPMFAGGPDPAQNNPPVAETATQYTVVDYNLENLYDYRNNPSSGCDFLGDPGCPKVAPFLAAVNPPYDYVPASDDAYEARLTDIASQIVNDLHSPDILMVQEVENQDICSVVDGAFACGTTDNADGKPDVLQELALKVASTGGPTYDAAFDRNSSDLRGILPAFLYRTDRVELRPAAGDPVLGTTPTIGSYGSVPYDSDVSNPKTLNALLPAGVTACETSWVFPRAPSVALFRVWATGVGSGNYADIYAINNHFKSGPDTCVTHRTEQAKYNAALVAFIEAAKPDGRIVVAGDLNVYPRPDDPFAPIGAVGSSDQLGALYNPDLGLTNLWEVLLGQAPEAAYSYVYLGQAQTLDQMFTNTAMTSTLQAFRIAHINSDFPADYPGDVARGTSDHDPNVATFLLYPFGGFLNPVDSVPTLNMLKAGAAVPVKFSLGGDQGLAIIAAGYPSSRPIACDSSEPTDPVEETVTAGTSGLRYDATAGQYIYTWKTDKSWSGTCRALTVKLADGTTHDAYFKFTK